MIYVDSSVVLAQLLAEDRAPDPSFWLGGPLVSSRLLSYEVWNRINGRGLAGSHGEDVRTLLGRLAFLELAPQVLARALEPFPVPVRTLDALHLASLVFLRTMGQRPSLATYDIRLSSAAAALNIPLVPLAAGSIRIDLNADMGEGAGSEEELIPSLTSVNVACGGHAGDLETMTRTVELARRCEVAVGAHPGYPDREGFGRRELDLSAEELERSIAEQLAALAGVCEAASVEMTHVKAHGALYNRAAVDPELAAVVARAVRRFSPTLRLIGLAGSALLDAGRKQGLEVASEAFADRAYEADGTLRSRAVLGAVHKDPGVAAAQAISIARDHAVRAHDGHLIKIQADTICIHGDTPGAAQIARAVRAALAEAGVDVRALTSPDR